MLCFLTPDDLESCSGVAVPSRRSQRRLSDGSRPEKDCWRRCGFCLVCGSRRQPRGPSLLPCLRKQTTASWSIAIAISTGFAATELDLRQRIGSNSCQPVPGKVIPPWNHPRARKDRNRTRLIEYRGRDSRLTIIRTPRTVARRASTRRRRRQGRGAWSARRPENVMGAKRHALVAGGVRGGKQWRQPKKYADPAVHCA